MPDLGQIPVYSARWQLMVMLFATLSEVRGGLTKADTIARIQQRTWFDIQPDDRIPYRANQHTSHEHRWITAIALARQDAVDQSLIHNHARDNWDLTTDGLNCLATIARAFREHRLDVRLCYLWTSAFKLRMDSAYTTGQPELSRPITLYEDVFLRHAIDTLLARSTPRPTSNEPRA